MEKVQTTKKVEILKNVLVILSFALMFFVFNQATIFSAYFKPFAVAVLFATVFTKLNLWEVLLSYAISSVGAIRSLNELYISLSIIVVFGIIAIVNSKKSLNLASIYVLLVISQIPLMALSFTSTKMAFACIVSILISIVCMVACKVLFSIIESKRYSYILNTDELICISVVFIIFCMGLSKCVFYFELIKIFGVFIILTMCYLFDWSKTLFFSTLIGLGASLSSANLGYVAVFVGYALIVLAFKTKYKLLSILGAVSFEIILGLYFKVYATFNIFSVLSVVLGGIIFLCIPRKLTNIINQVMYSKNGNLATKNVLNRTTNGMCNRLNELSQVFLDMQNAYKNMVKGSIPINDAKELIKNELVLSVCRKCPNKNNCLRLNGQFSGEMLDNLIDSGVERGKITLLDVSSYMTTKCVKINVVINTLNSIIKNYKSYNNMVKAMDTSKLLLADQLDGVSQVLKNLVEEVNMNVSFDESLDEKIKEELAYSNIICEDALVYCFNTTKKNVTLVIKNNFDSKLLEQVVSKTLASKHVICSVTPSSVPLTQIVSLCSSPTFDLVFGSANCNKSGVVKSGDSQTLIKLSNGKYMAAIADGMGSGKSASAISELSLKLIESFYKAGFDNELILNNVNKLLSLSNDEQYSTLDVCIMDFYKQTYDFIKLGAPIGFIKSNNGVEIIESSGLPIGVLDEMKPHITCKMINSFDIVVLCSDGVVDSFSSIDALSDTINNYSTINPQTLAENLLNDAKNNYGGIIEDDMTVVAIRIFPI